MTSYKDAGVDIDAADETKKAMKESMDSNDPRVLNHLGAFASLVQGSFDAYEEPILVLKTEEPGSKQKLAFQHDKIESICFDTINHLINDIIVMGADPLYVQDAVICGKIEKEKVTRLVKGFADACKAQNCVLVGGETSEQPGVLEVGTYILTASIVGVVDKKKIVDGSTIQKGDVVLGVASNGLHTNGYSLVRALMDKDSSLEQTDVNGETFVECIMKPHTCYYQAVKGLFGHKGLHGMAHITGGGIAGNLNRVLPEGCSAQIDASAIEILPIFKAIRDAGNVSDPEMLRTYNMGAGLVMVCSQDALSEIQHHLQSQKLNSFVIGSIIDGDQAVHIEGDLNW